MKAKFFDHVSCVLHIYYVTALTSTLNLFEFGKRNGNILWGKVI